MKINEISEVNNECDLQMEILSVPFFFAVSTVSFPLSEQQEFYRVHGCYVYIFIGRDQK